MRRGYWAVLRPDHPLAWSSGYVLEHRMVAWDSFGPFDPTCHVHHLNRDKLDNRPENLRVLTSSAHGREHHVIDRDEAVRLYRAGLTTVEVAARLGTHPGNISRMLAARGVPARSRLPAARRRQIRQRLRRGDPVARIARDLGCGRKTVDAERQALGLPARRPGRPTR
jgi:hypothetical protein